MFSMIRDILGFHESFHPKKCGADESSFRFLDYRDFEERILEERRRTDRSGLPFTVVVLSVPAENHAEECKKKWRNLLIRIISQRVRQCDSKGFFSRDHKKLGIILPNTHWEDSLVLVQSLEKMFNAELKSRTSEDSVDFELQCDVFSYPSDLIKQACPGAAPLKNDERLNDRLPALRKLTILESFEERIA